MRCPHCDTEIDDRLVAHHLAAKGGRASRRELDSEAARELQRRSVEARRRNKRKREQRDE